MGVGGKPKTINNGMKKGRPDMPPSVDRVEEDAFETRACARARRGRACVCSMLLVDVSEHEHDRAATAEDQKEILGRGYVPV